MMVLHAILDRKAQFYRFPIFNRNNGEAIRRFTTGVNDDRTELYLYPDDFVLCEIGIFDEETGLLKGLELPKQLCSGRDVMEMPETTQQVNSIKKKDNE